jgi:hypothetical protein
LNRAIAPVSPSQSTTVATRLSFFFARTLLVAAAPRALASGSGWAAVIMGLVLLVLHGFWRCDAHAGRVSSSKSASRRRRHERARRHEVRRRQQPIVHVEATLGGAGAVAATRCWPRRSSAFAWPPAPVALGSAGRLTCTALLRTTAPRRRPARGSYEKARPEPTMTRKRWAVVVYSEHGTARKAHAAAIALGISSGGDDFDTVAVLGATSYAVRFFGLADAKRYAAACEDTTSVVDVGCKGSSRFNLTDALVLRRRFADIAEPGRPVEVGAKERFAIAEAMLIEDAARRNSEIAEHTGVSVSWVENRRNDLVDARVVHRFSARVGPRAASNARAQHSEECWCQVEDAVDLDEDELALV